MHTEGVIDIRSRLKTLDGRRSPSSLAKRATIAIVAAAILAIAPVSVAQAKPAPADDFQLSSAVEAKYIVVLKPDADRSAQGRVVQVAEGRGGRVSHKYSHAINGFAAALPAAALAEVRGDPEVDYVESDGRATINSTQLNPPWGLDRIDQRDLPLDNSYTTEVVGAGEATGRGVKVYVIDSGIWSDHPEFAGRASIGYGSSFDGNGHGTHVAGTIGGSTYGVAKEVTLVGVQVFDWYGNASFADIIGGLDWVTGNHQSVEPAVANMSFGTPPGQAPSLALEQAVNTSIADGITYVAAAGNENRDACDVSPARVPKVLTVGATTTLDGRWVEGPQDGSNRGPCLDIFAPGKDVTSAWPTDTVITSTGTSSAAPHVAGVAAQYLQAYPCALPTMVAGALHQMATPNKVTDPGLGSPNLLLRAGVLMPCFVICTPDYDAS